jgi:hypothetical protein
MPKLHDSLRRAKLDRWHWEITKAIRPNSLFLLFWALLTGLNVTGTAAMAIEEPKYTVSLHEGAFEVRDYQAAVAAEVTVAGDQKSAAREGFRLLAGYIFGGNTRQQSIAMTAPVAQERRSEKIAMTAPVTQTPSEGAWVVRFTMPSSYSLDTLPAPTNPKVKLRNVPPARFAVVQFSGYANNTSLPAKAAELAAFAKAHHLHTIGAASLAQYNPPWTLWFMRRNEVMIQLEAT